MPDQPNIVFILVDDMGYGDFSAFNDGRSRTPVLDALITESVCFTQNYTGSPVCNPSRASLLTGRYPHRTGSIDTLEWRGLERLALREVTLADVLRAAGYRTGLVGKWHLGAFDPRYHPERRGFDESICFRGGMHDYYQWRLERGDQVLRADGRYLTDVWTDEAVAFIKRHAPATAAAAAAATPFFLHVTYNAPHTPLQCPDEDVEPFRGRDDLTPAVQTLYGMIRRMDNGVGRILEALDACGLRDNTLVVFTSDNGPQFGGQGDRCLNRFNCGFNGAKGRTYEGGIRVPLVARWPAGVDGGRSVDRMTHMTDWFTSLAAIGGGEVPRDRTIDGWDVSPLLSGGPCEVNTRRFWQWNRYTPLVECNAGMRDGDWKLVRPAIGEAMAVPDIHWLQTCMYEHEYFIEHGIITEPDPPRDVPPPPPAELYNLADDPLEQNDLAAEQPERASKMLRELETWFEEVETERATIED
jgi:arylsulfatase A